MERLNIDDAVPIAHNIVNRTIEQAQTRVEGANFDTRKHLLDYDDVLNQQREVFYSQRDRIFVKGDLSQDLNEMLLAEVEEHVVTAMADPEGPWKLLAWLEETQPTLGLESANPHPSFMLAILLDQLEGAESPDKLKSILLDISQQSLEANKVHLLRTVDDQLTRAIERLDDQVSSRVETAEIAVEAAIYEAEDSGGSVDPRQLLSVVEQAAGLRIQMDDQGLQAIRDDPHRFLRRIPELVETSMGLRIWASLVQAVERRIGEPLGLQPSAGGEIDWDHANEELQQALGAAWDQRTKALVNEIANDLDLALSRTESPTMQDRLRLLVQMSYGQRSFFDRKTHQRQSVLVSRLSYPYYASDLILDRDAEELSLEVHNHLEGAQTTLELALGRAEFQRVAASTFDQLDERAREHLRSTLSESMYDTLTQEGALQDKAEDLQQQAARALGNQLLTRTYRELFLSVADREWVEYLTQMEALRTSIGLEAYGQRDPLVQYKSRAFDLFGSLFNTIRAGVISRMFRLRAATPATAGMGVTPPQAGGRPASPSAPAKAGKRKRRRRRRK
jgi:preprotein translocase subunit SecA